MQQTCPNPAMIYLPKCLFMQEIQLAIEFQDTNKRTRSVCCPYLIRLSACIMLAQCTYLNNDRTFTLADPFNSCPLHRKTFPCHGSHTRWVGILTHLNESVSRSSVPARPLYLQLNLLRKQMFQTIELNIWLKFLKIFSSNMFWINLLTS